VDTTIKTIVLSEVLTRAREYFNCPTLDGLDLEDEGDSASAGSHWERKIMFNELMTASDIPDARVTEFTLALLEGTGWYSPDYTMVEPLTWGKGAGCGFVQASCIDSSTKLPTYKEFCGPAQEEGCYWGNRYRASCGYKTGNPTDQEYDYWGNHTISKDDFSNNCPYFLPYPNGDCENDTNQGSTILSEEFGKGSKCFEVTLAKQTSSSGAFKAIQSSCYKSECKLISDNTYELQITVANKMVVCTDSGGDKTVPGFYGVLKCPIASEFCRLQNQKFCENACSGRGTCSSSKECVCDEGWSGSDCSEPIEVDDCTRCSTMENGFTSCYGDGCLCPGVQDCSSSAVNIQGYTKFGIFVLIVLMILF